MRRWLLLFRQPIGARDIVPFVAWLVTLAVAYLLSVASDGVTELAYAVIFGLAGALLISLLHRADLRTYPISFRAILILAGRALKGAAKESWLLLGPRLLSQLRGRPVEGRYIRIVIDRRHSDPEGNGRLAGVLWVQAFTPNAIPLFVDGDQLVLHQLIHRREPNADDREFPA